MPKTFRFAEATWFRRPLKALVICVFVFAVLSLYPAFTQGTENDAERAIFGLTVLMGFFVSATALWVAVDDSYIELDAESVYIRFEGFFHAEFPTSDIVRVEQINPKPAWRFRFGLSTNFIDRIACSHGGQLVEIELAHAWRTRLWPRRIPVQRFWLGLPDSGAFIDELRQLVPHAFEGADPESLDVAA
jgi:hypothetical protein